MAVMDEGGATKILNRDVKGRLAVPRAQREALVEEFERSGLAATQFAQALGIHYSTFAWWVRQRRRDREGGPNEGGGRLSAVTLVEAVPASQKLDAAPCVEVQALELTLPGGAKLRITGVAQVALAVQLINALRTSC